VIIHLVFIIFLHKFVDIRREVLSDLLVYLFKPSLLPQPLEINLRLELEVILFLHMLQFQVRRHGNKPMFTDLPRFSLVLLLEAVEILFVKVGVTHVPGVG